MNGRALGHLPPVDPEVLAALRITPSSTSDLLAGRIDEWRHVFGSGHEIVDQAVRSGSIDRVDYELPVSRGRSITLSVLSNPNAVGLQPGIYFAHGGGLMAGTRFSEADGIIDWVSRLGAVVATVEYALAPEHGYSVAVNDVIAGMRWFFGRASELGVDAGRIVIAGVSAGGGLAASAVQLAVETKDASLTGIAGQLLLSPMLDDRHETASSQQCHIGPWPQAANVLAWASSLAADFDDDSSQSSDPQERTPDAERRASARQSIKPPSRAVSLAGLPSTYIEVGSAEVFRDEGVEYASRLWMAGVQAELHVWAGGTHGFDIYAHTALAQATVDARVSWLSRVLDVTPVAPMERSVST